jgi:Protein of unknown function (DUF4242)
MGWRSHSVVFTRPEEEQVKTFIIEREIPGAAELSEEELTNIAKTSCDAMSSLDRPYRWLHSYVAGDKFYCVHSAGSEEDVREHARIGGFPVNAVTEVAAVVDGGGTRGVPA